MDPTGVMTTVTSTNSGGLRNAITITVLSSSWWRSRRGRSLMIGLVGLGGIGSNPGDELVVEGAVGVGKLEEEGIEFLGVNIYEWEVFLMEMRSHDEPECV